MKNIDIETIRKAVWDYYDYSACVRNQFVDIIAHTLDRCEDLRNTDWVIEEALEYIALQADEWEILRHYCEYDNADWERAEAEYIDDVLAIASRVASECYDEEDEDDEEEDE